MSTPPRVVCFGEMLLRLSPPDAELLFDSPMLATWFGGAEANVAVALSHLGIRCDYLTRLPPNPLGDAALAALQCEGVGTGWIARGGSRLGLYFVESGPDLRAMRVVYDRAGSAFAELAPFDWPAVLAGAGWFHSTGITPALGPVAAAALAEAAATAAGLGIPFSLDLNYREALWSGRDPRAALEPLARQAAVLIGNLAAVNAMLGMAAPDAALESAESAHALAAAIGRRFGNRLVVLTRRVERGPREHDWSAALYDAASDDFRQSRRYRMPVLDRVGGGDAFCAALLAELLAEQPPAEALEFAVAAGALKLGIPGDWSRLTRPEVAAFQTSRTDLTDLTDRPCS